LADRKEENSKKDNDPAASASPGMGRRFAEHRVLLADEKATDQARSSEWPYTVRKTWM
jgi:hypothetical protein